MTNRYERIRKARQALESLRERCAQEAERITGRRRVVASMVSSQAVKPCEVAIAIRKIDVQQHYECAAREIERMRTEIEALRAERDALAQENELLRKDAERYRCLSAMATQQADYLGPIFRIDVRRSEPYLFNFDAAVDAAMQRTSGGDHD